MLIIKNKYNTNVFFLCLEFSALESVRVSKDLLECGEKV